MKNLSFEINSKLNKTGKRTVFFATINGLRINGTNWTVKKEAQRDLEHFRKQFSDDKILRMVSGVN